MKLDWFDAVLFAFGFALAAVLAVVLDSFGWDSTSEVAVECSMLVFVAGPLFLRRKFFGAPNVGELKDGALWSLLSMVGLLLILFGTGLFGLSVLGLPSVLVPPDFEAQVRDSHGEPFYFDSEETPAQREVRQAQDRVSEARLIAQIAAENRERWEDERNGQWITLGCAIGLVGAGIFFTRLRFKPC